MVTTPISSNSCGDAKGRKRGCSGSEGRDRIGSYGNGSDTSMVLVTIVIMALRIMVMTLVLIIFKD